MQNRQVGAVSIGYLALLMPMIVAAAATIVIGYQVQLSNRAAQAVDAASLACAFAGSADKQRNQAYLNYYRSNVASVKTKADNSSGCKVKMGYQLSSLFSGLSFSKAAFSADAESNERAYFKSTPSFTPTELVVVLDISGSMSGALPQLKQILNRAIGSLKAQQQIKGGNPDNIKLSVVPFTQGVSVNNPPWLSDAGVFCANGLTKQGGVFSAAQTVADLDTTHRTKPIEYYKPNRWRDDCSATSTTLPLTSNLDLAGQHINRLSVEGSTSSYQGLIWGIRQLTPNWQRDWRTTTRSKVRPIRKLVLMTDGDDNDDRFDDLVAAGLCRKAADQYGIELNFIGFNVRNSRLEQLNRCVKSGKQNQGGVFAASNNNQLTQYFNQILKVEYQTILNFGNK